MAYLATNEFAGTGAVMQVEINFTGNRPDAASGTTPYFKVADVLAEVITPATSTTAQVSVPMALTSINGNTFRTATAVPVGRVLRVYRKTEDRYPLVDFKALQLVTELDLDNLTRQAVFMAGEAKDAAGIARSDASTAIMFAALANIAANQAVAAANAAVVTAGQAASNASSAVSVASNAAQVAGQALSTANGAATVAGQASTAAASATQTANAASLNAANALTQSGQALSTSAGAAQSAAAAAAFAQQIQDLVASSPSAAALGVNLADKNDPTNGAGLIGWDGVTVGKILDDARVLSTYADLRAYTGRATTITLDNDDMQGRFRRRGVIPGAVEVLGIRIIAANNVVWDRINPEPVRVSWFGAVGGGIVDDGPAFQRCADYLASIGGGKAKFFKKHLIDTALSVKDYVSFEGDLNNPGELRFDGTSDYDGKRSVIFINPAITVTSLSGATFGHCLVIRKGLDLPFADAAAATAGLAAFAGTAFTAGGSDCEWSHMLILGFQTGILSDGFERPRASHIHLDCNSGVDFRTVLDIAYVNQVHCWPFSTTHFNWTTGALNSRPGIGVNFQATGDWSKISECFTYGYAIGFRVFGCNFVNVVNCGSDGYGLAASTAIGLFVGGNSKMTTVEAYQAAAQGYGIVVDTPSGTAAVTKISGGCFWDGDIKHIDVRSGRAVITGNSLWKCPVGIDVNGTAASAIIDCNDFEDITGNAISTGSFDNLQVGRLNRFTNSVNNIGPRTVVDFALAEIQQQSNNSAVGTKIQHKRSRGTTAAKLALIANDEIANSEEYGHDGSNFIGAGGIRLIVRAVAAANNMSTAYLIQTRAAGAANPVDRLIIDSDGSVKPAVTNGQTLGSASNLWASVWSSTGTIQTSDKRTKTDITDAALGLSFVNQLRPVSYRWKAGHTEVVGQEVDEEGKSGDLITKVTPGSRTHWGLIAQEVKAVVDAAGVDFGGWVLSDENDKNSQQALRYDQFISPLIKAVQELSARVVELEKNAKE